MELLHGINTQDGNLKLFVWSSLQLLTKFQFQATWWRSATFIAPWTVSSVSGHRGHRAVYPVAVD